MISNELISEYLNDVYLKDLYNVTRFQVRSYEFNNGIFLVYYTDNTQKISRIILDFPKYQSWYNNTWVPKNRDRKLNDIIEDDTTTE